MSEPVAVYDLDHRRSDQSWDWSYASASCYKKIMKTVGQDEDGNPSAGPEASRRDEIASFRPLLYRLALFQLRDPEAAEDIVHDTLVAAIEKQRSFEGRSSLRTWVISILRFKVIDALRKRKHLAQPIDGAALSRELDLAAVEQLFNPAGRWAAPNQSWSDPTDHVHHRQFFQVLEACMTKLPVNMSRAFLMREWLELPTPEICATLQVSSGNLRILLYRARMQLRACLDKSWGRN